MNDFSRAGGTAARQTGARVVGRLQMVGFACAVAYATFLAASVFHGAWLYDEFGRPVPNDFVNVYAAGRLVLQGHAVAAYDWTLHRQAEHAAIGYAFDGYFNWPYPPTFLFVAGLLALLPPVPAMLAWMAATLPLYVATIRMVVGRRVAIALACGFTGVPLTLSVGQNGFLTAALIGGALFWIERRPVLAGILLGLLTYKPHFGLLFPVALAVGGYWRVIATATATAGALAIASTLSFGWESWQAFIQAIFTTGEMVFAEGRAGLVKQQSLMGCVRWLGGGTLLAGTLQGLLIAACTTGVVLAWRRPLAIELKAAVLGVAAMLATPYLYIYDFPALAVPMAFVVRLGLNDGFLRGELAGLAAASGLVLVYPVVPAPTGLLATFIVAAIVVRRTLARSCAQPSGDSPSGCSSVPEALSGA
jgi:arabinofuranan 3-O-arabinosyltransferase